MGESYSYHMPVSDMLGEKLVITFLLTLLSFVFTIVLSIPLGILAGSIRSGWLDGLVTAIDQVVMSVPAFFIGILSCFFFGIVLKLFVPGVLRLLYPGLGGPSSPILSSRPCPSPFPASP